MRAVDGGMESQRKDGFDDGEDLSKRAACAAPGTRAIVIRRIANHGNGSSDI
jgi:hypothetical protein